MPNDHANAIDLDDPDAALGLIVLSTGKGLLDDLWSLYREELRRMPTAWKDLTADEIEQIEGRAFRVFESVVNTMALRAATAAVAKGRPTVKGELLSVTVKDKAKAVVEFSTGQPGFDELIHETGSAVLVVLAAEVDTVRADDPKEAKPDPTGDLFEGGPKEQPVCECGYTIISEEESAANRCSACGLPISVPLGSVTVGDAPVPQL